MEFFLPHRPTYLEAVLIGQRLPAPQIPGYRTSFHPVELGGSKRVLRLIERVDR
jgi:hypothetical protein